ncbi:tetratricopeptide repeat protein [Streptomyces bobili]|uniref:tetratricopeptide repeat protein n=1 Tax=Streptomyces bobili TaxID=67280 RepID=UPI00371436FA
MTAVAGHLAAEQHILHGNELERRGRPGEAEPHYRRAIAASPDHAMAHNNLAWVLHAQGRDSEAVSAYYQALALDAGLVLARRNLSGSLLNLGRREESLALWQEAGDVATEDRRWLADQAWRAMRRDDTHRAGDFAYLHAAVSRGSRWYPRPEGRQPPSTTPPEGALLTVGKLRHDAEQFRYLRDRGLLDAEFTPIIRAYEETADRLAAQGIHDEQVPFDVDTLRTIGHVYGRIVHIRDTPRVDHALSSSWDATAVERQYLDQPPGVVVIDDFLTNEALERLNLFCLESTVWSGNRYAHGRLGAFFIDGFNCPLLLQIAEELQQALPRVIGHRYPLRQLWGFKNGQTLPAATTTHADFAAVNVNFWITPTEANLEPDGGGLEVYGIDAPPDWDFNTYNARLDIIGPFLRRRGARSVNIPYRGNRAVLFNSDLFHATAGLNFRPGYKNRRVNITMLYGERAQDTDHQQLSRLALPSYAAWRSAAFSSARRAAGR